MNYEYVCIREVHVYHQNYAGLWLEPFESLDRISECDLVYVPPTDCYRLWWCHSMTMHRLNQFTRHWGIFLENVYSLQGSTASFDAGTGHFHPTKSQNHNVVKMALFTLKETISQIKTSNLPKNGLNMMKSSVDTSPVTRHLFQLTLLIVDL